SSGFCPGPYQTGSRCRTPPGDRSCGPAPPGRGPVKWYRSWCFLPNRVKKAAACSGMAGGALRGAVIEQGVGVTVGNHILHREEVARVLALVPQFLAAAGPEPSGLGL